jgi:hypothetical protein
MTTKTHVEAATIDRRHALGSLAGAGAALLAAPKIAKAAPAAGPEIATAEQVAALEFKPWTDEDASPEVAREWCTTIESHLNAVMLAAIVQRKTKAHLEEVVRALHMDENAEDAIDSLIKARETFEQAASILQTAEIRMMSAYASVLKQDDHNGFAEA